MHLLSLTTMEDHSLHNSSKPESTEATTRFYNDNALEYFRNTVAADLSPIYRRFVKYLAPGSSVLDIGCGSGRDVKALRDRGYSAIGIDASSNLLALAADFCGGSCITGRFEDFLVDRPYDAAWACASLVHVRKSELLPILSRIRRALVRHGFFFTSVQVGEGETILPDGRFFAYYQPAEWNQCLMTAGFQIDEGWTSEDSLRSERGLQWINVIAHRK